MRFLSALGLLLFSTVAVFAETRTATYKTIDGAKLDLTIQLPDGWKPEDKRPAIVFFFGGGWTNGSPTQFENQARYLASRGMVAMAAGYRVKSRHGVKAASCVADAKSALRWVRAHAAQWGIDPQRIGAGGGSAGGHLAAAVALLPGLDDPADDKATTCVPNALVLFNPALVLAPTDEADLKGFLQIATPERFGCDPLEISPLHHIKPGAPPTIIFHGRSDTTVPYSSVELFRDRMLKAGNRCELIGAEGQAHGFFNFGRNENRYAFETLEATDRFLVSLGWLSGDPSVKTYFAAHPPVAGRPSPAAK